jgi:hypothetical protein
VVVLPISNDVPSVERDLPTACQSEIYGVVGRGAQFDGKPSDGGDAICPEHCRTGCPDEIGLEPLSIQVPSVDFPIVHRKRAVLGVHHLAASNNAGYRGLGPKRGHAAGQRVRQKFVVGIEENDELSAPRGKAGVSSGPET